MKKRYPAVLLAILCAGSIAGAGYSLCRGNNHPVPVPAAPGFRRVEIREAAGKTTVAWVLEGTTGKAFILAHGNSSDRNAMVPRAVYFHGLGYAAILPDLNGHGETAGSRKTFGIEEARDIENAYLYLKKKMGKEWIGGLGTSLGGAALLKAESNGVAFDALILESVFSDIRTAARNRLEMRFGKTGGLFEPLLTLQIPFWLGVSRDELSPLEWAKAARCPTLVLSGDLDRHAKPGESQGIFANIPSPKKSLKLFAGAGHVDLFAFDSAGYRAEIESFLNQ